MSDILKEFIKSERHQLNLIFGVPILLTELQNSALPVLYIHT